MARWLLFAVGYLGATQVQAQGVISIIKFFYRALPFILIITLCLADMKIGEENKN